MNNVEPTKLNDEEISKIKAAIAEKRSVEFTCYTLTPEQKSRFLGVLSCFLEECGQSQLFNYLSYCLLELLDNASKANAKRIYFQRKNLNINDEKDYANGMADFKTNLDVNNTDYFDELNKGYLQVILHLSSDDNIVLKVTNNTKVTEKEYNRILSKIENTNKYASFQDALADIDATEGCGLGIVSIILMLKNLGLSKDNLKFNVTDDQTEAIIEIPTDLYADLESL